MLIFVVCGEIGVDFGDAGFVVAGGNICTLDAMSELLLSFSFKLAAWIRDAVGLGFVIKDFAIVLLVLLLTLLS